METRWDIWRATIRLAMIVSVIGIAAALTVGRIGLLPEQAVVFGVMGVGFVTSWIRSGRRSLTRVI